jgi:hypothetical protein
MQRVTDSRAITQRSISALQQELRAREATPRPITKCFLILLDLPQISRANNSLAM